MADKKVSPQDSEETSGWKTIVHFVVHFEQSIRIAVLLLALFPIHQLKMWCSQNSSLTDLCFLYLESFLYLIIYSKFMTLLFQFVDNGFQLKRIIEWFRNSYKSLFIIIVAIIVIEQLLALSKMGMLEKLLFSISPQMYNGVEFDLNIFKSICKSIVDNVVTPFLFIFIMYFYSYKIAEIKRKNAYNKVSKQNSNQKKLKKETEKLFYGKCKLNGNPNVIDVLLEYHSENERSYLYLIFKGKGADKKVDFLRDIKGLGVGYSYNIVKVFVSTIDYHVFIKTADQEKIHLVFCDSNNEVDKAMAFYEFMMIIKHLLKNEKLNVKIDFIDMREEVGPNVRIDPIYGIAEYLS